MKNSKITVWCYRCREIELPYNQYIAQLSRPNQAWYCPQCYALAEFHKYLNKCFDPYCAGWADNTGYDICDTCGEWQYELFRLYGENGIERWQQCYQNEEIEYSVEWKLNADKI